MRGNSEDLVERREEALEEALRVGSRLFGQGATLLGTGGRRVLQLVIRKGGFQEASDRLFFLEAILLLNSTNPHT